MLGTLLAFSIVRGRYRGREALTQISALPIIVPSIVYSIAVYGLFAKLRLIGLWQGIALAHTVLAIPYVTIIVAAGLRTFDIAQEQAAMGLGASRLTAVRRVTLPQIRPSLISAAFLAFIASFDELVVAMFLGGSNMTLPKKMFDNIMMEIDPTIAAVSVLKITLVTATAGARRKIRGGRAAGGVTLACPPAKGLLLEAFASMLAATAYRHIRSTRSQLPTRGSDLRALSASFLIFCDGVRGNSATYSR